MLAAKCESGLTSVLECAVALSARRIAAVLVAALDIDDPLKHYFTKTEDAFSLTVQVVGMK